MDINAMFESKYLKKEDFPQPRALTIRDITMENMAMEGHPPENKPVLYFHEVSKGMTINKINSQLIIMALGTSETTQWMNRQITLYCDPSVSMQGKLVGGIRVQHQVSVQQQAPATLAGALNQAAPIGQPAQGFQQPPVQQPQQPQQPIQSFEPVPQQQPVAQHQAGPDNPAYDDDIPFNPGS